MPPPQQEVITVSLTSLINLNYNRINKNSLTEEDVISSISRLGCIDGSSCRVTGDGAVASAGLVKMKSDAVVFTGLDAVVLAGLVVNLLN